MINERLAQLIRDKTECEAMIRRAAAHMGGRCRPGIYMVLYAIAASRVRPTGNEIRASCLAGSNVSYALRELKSEGLLKLEFRIGRRREKDIVLTERGREFGIRLIETVDAWAADLAAKEERAMKARMKKRA